MTVDSIPKIRELLQTKSAISMGAHTSYAFAADPKHLSFTLARYKFVAKMLQGHKNVCEIGCGDGFGATLVAQGVDHLTGIDIEPYVLENCCNAPLVNEKMDFIEHDILNGALKSKYTAAFSLDVIEHIQPAQEEVFLRNIVESIVPNGVIIIGTPNLTAAPYASLGSQIAHINLKSYDTLKKSLQQFCKHVFMFGMNDEVLHTGYGPMCHYLMALGVL